MNESYLENIARLLSQEANGICIDSFNDNSDWFDDVDDSDTDQYDIVDADDVDDEEQMFRDDEYISW